MQKTNSNEISGKNKARRIALSCVILLIGIPLLIALGMTVWHDRKYYIISLGIILLSSVPLLMKFEKKRPQAREIVVLAVMTAIAVASRVAFYMLPQFKPISAVIIITGAAFGAEEGFIVGACAGFISNFFFGQGPWTPWQIFGFGIIGFIAGLMFYKGAFARKLIPICIYGAVATFILYGAIVDTGTVFMYTNKPTWKFALSVYASGIPFNAIHAGATVIFLALLAKPLFNKIDRVKTKFGLLEE